MIRPARPEDWPAIVAIQVDSPEASQWDPAGFTVTVAESDSAVVGFLVTRAVAEDEVEVLNLAVRPSSRRSGVARGLLASLLETVSGSVYLEVRESNLAARKLYESLGFRVIAERPDYYDCP